MDAPRAHATHGSGDLDRGEPISSKYRFGKFRTRTSEKSAAAAEIFDHRKRHTQASREFAGGIASALESIACKTCSYPGKPAIAKTIQPRRCWLCFRQRCQRCDGAHVSNHQTAR